MSFAAGFCAWFAALEENNNKAWFEENRAFWEDGIRQPLAALMEETAAQRGGLAKVFRINRDVRFSKDKSPYKTNTAGYVSPETGAAVIYASLGKSGLYAGSGYHDMAKDQVARFRVAVLGAAGVELSREVESLRADGLEVRGRALKTAPRGFPKDHERIDLLRMKEIIAGALLPPTGVEAGESESFAMGIWDRTESLRDWLDTHVGPCQVPPAGMFGRQ
jgi:uncharacterized protein (TIGR02453 family)